MPKQKWKRYLPAFAVALLVVLAYALRVPVFPWMDGPRRVLLRAAIYLGLFIAWGVSVSQRVIQLQSRRLFTAIAALMVSWLLFRTVRFLSSPDSSNRFNRYCWYFYYVPMLYIPLLAALLAFLLGKPEHYRLPRWTLGLYAAAGCIALLVLTNDFHHLMFVFPAYAPASNDRYYYGAGYLLPAAWRYGGLLSTLLLVFARSRLPGRGRRLLLPILPTLLLAAYHVCYLLELPWLRSLFNDLTVVECLLVICILECCLRTGLIQANTHYEELFRTGVAGAVIVDAGYNERIAGHTSLPPETLRQAANAPVMLENGLRLSSAPIQGGHVLWVEDISELLAVTAELADKREYLTEQVVVRQKEVEARRREQALSERNRLYDKVVGEMQDAIDLFSRLTGELEACEDSAEEALLTARLAIVCTQLKRSVNLVFIEESRGRINAGELFYAVREWLVSLRLAGVRCDCAFELNEPLAFSGVLALYGALTRILLTALDGLESLFIRAREAEKKPLFLIDACCRADLSVLEAPGLSVEREDGDEWLLELTPGGGPE